MPADMGKVTVIKDTDEYEQKVTSRLSDDKTYEKLNKDPNPKYNRKLVSIIKKLIDEDKVTDEQYLYPTAEYVPRMVQENISRKSIVEFVICIGKTRRAELKQQLNFVFRRCGTSPALQPTTLIC